MMGNNNSIDLGVTLGRVICPTCWSSNQEKRESKCWLSEALRLTLCSVSLYNAVFSSVTRLTASYIFLGLFVASEGGFTPVDLVKFWANVPPRFILCRGIHRCTCSPWWHLYYTLQSWFPLFVSNRLEHLITCDFNWTYLIRLSVNGTPALCFHS